MSVEIDVHGLTADEAIASFLTAYNREVARASPRALRVVHGYGSTGSGGVIRRKLRALLEQHSGCLTWFAGENVDTNPGYTLVQPHLPLPTGTDLLAASILEYCSTARTEEKIAGEFRRHSAGEIKECIRRLVRQKQLIESLKNGRTVFTAQVT